MAAEYDNYRKRNEKDKISIYSDAKAKTIFELLPIADCIERAIESSKDADSEYQKGLVASAIIISLIYLIICVIIMKNQRKNIVLKMENEMNQKLLKVQSEYYDMRLKKETETKRFRHDIKGHIMCIQMLYEKKKV